MLALSACNRPSQTAPTVLDEAAIDAGWPFAPVSVRIHPLTRLRIDDRTERPVIEARVELLDVDGMTTRGLGFLTLMLGRSYQGGIAPEDVIEWDCDLNDLSTNRLRFDDVTRTYLLRLDLNAGDVPEQPVVAVRFVVPGGHVLQHQRPLDQ